MVSKISIFLLRLAIGVLAVACSTPVLAQKNEGPCRLVSFADVADWTGNTVKNNLPQGNLKVLASCTFGGVDRPAVLSYAVTRGASDRDGYASNKMWPDVAEVTGIGEEAMWIPLRRMLTVLVRNDLNVHVTIDDRDVAGSSGHLELAKKIVMVLIERLGD